MSSRLSWHEDHDISMVDINTNTSQRAFTGADLSIPDLYREDSSSRLLLQPQDGSLTSDFDGPRLRRDDGGNVPTKRQRVNAQVKRVLRKPSFMSARTASTFDGNFAHGKPGWWDKQMLVDRSLRSMAAFTAMCAVIMFIIVFSYIPAFARRLNRSSTSVGGSEGESCHTMESRNVAVHLFINIAATMILGCSNTYQQLITALKVDEIRWVLSNRGDSKVGTNSPWAINHKKSGKAKAWLCWWLLISTSVPVHFLANSVIGPSFYVKAPETVTYILMDEGFSYKFGSRLLTDPTDFSCWSAFRTHNYVLPESLSDFSRGFNVDTLDNSTTFKNVEVHYTNNCTEFLDNVDRKTALADGIKEKKYGDDYIYFSKNASNGAPCDLGTDVVCGLSEPSKRQCRMNVRMQAAFILSACLIIKAVYMITVNYRARSRTKHHCLTFGDVIVASVLDPELKIQNECMLNSGDGYRNKVKHNCHKHCKSKIPSMSGDEIGHCQKCKKFNDIDMAADLPHPQISIKFKRSLLSNLGSTAIMQMIILMFTSFAMLGVTIVLLVSMADSASEYKHQCNRQPIDSYFDKICTEGASKYIAGLYGTWGGFSSSATVTALPADSLSSEFMAFAISNGAQFLYSLLYLLLIYNLSLVAMEHEWGTWETKRKRPRCTLVSGKPFDQSYFLQLPSKILIPLMSFASLMHWLLGQAVSTIEMIFSDPKNHAEHSVYFVVYAAYPIFLSTFFMIGMTVVCWWAFTYTREGFIPQMYGSIRTCCASTTELTDFVPEGILWGDLGMGEKFRHAGFSSDEPGPIIPAELYCGKGK